jgi:hypothetical protein
LDFSAPPARSSNEPSTQGQRLHAVVGRAGAKARDWAPKLHEPLDAERFNRVFGPHYAFAMAGLSRLNYLDEVQVGWLVAALALLAMALGAAATLPALATLCTTGGVFCGAGSLVVISHQRRASDMLADARTVDNSTLPGSGTLAIQCALAVAAFAASIVGYA